MSLPAAKERLPSERSDELLALVGGLLRVAAMEPIPWERSDRAT